MYNLENSNNKCIKGNHDALAKIILKELENIPKCSLFVKHEAIWKVQFKAFLEYNFAWYYPVNNCCGEIIAMYKYFVFVEKSCKGYLSCLEYGQRQ